MAAAYGDWPKHAKEGKSVLKDYVHISQNYCYNRHKICLKTIWASDVTNSSNMLALDCK